MISFENNIEFILPFEKASLYKSVFSKLKEHKEEYGIKSYGISMSSTTEIFNRITRDDNSNGSDIPQDLTQLVEISGIERLGGLRLYFQQFRGHFIRNILYSMRNWKLITIQLLLPSLLTIIGVVIVITGPQWQDQAELDLSFKSYKGFNVPTEIPLCLNPIDGFNTTSKLFLSDGSVVESIKYSECNHTMRTWLMKEASKNIIKFNRKVPMAIESVNQNQKVLLNQRNAGVFIKSWYNGEGYHTIPIAVQYADNMALQYYLGEDFLLSGSNWPMPLNKLGSIRSSSDLNFQGMTITISLLVGIMMMCSTFTIAPVVERINGVRSLQHCSGSPIWMSWICQFTWDFINSIPAFILITVIMYSSQSVTGISSIVDEYNYFTILYFFFILGTSPLTRQV